MEIHPVLGLAFSGGKDSLACWYLYRDVFPLVIWVNTGKAYPETLRVVQMVRSQSRFLEVHSDQQAQIDREGLPSDIVPIDCTRLGMLTTRVKPVGVQSYIGCCYENIARPLLEAAKNAGIKELIYGQRDDEEHKAPVTDGQVVEGIKRLQPIQRWSRQAVMDYLKSQGEVPAHFALDHSSMDCYDCTAYLAHSQDRAAWSKEHSPELYEKWKAKMALLRSAVAPTMNLLMDTNHA